mgnify:CR=1 FL=1
MKTLKSLRQSIDQVDEIVAQLLNERARLALKIGRVKTEQGIEVHQPEREQEVLQRVREVGSTGHLGSDGAERIFQTIIEVSRSLEHQQQQEGSCGLMESLSEMWK